MNRNILLERIVVIGITVAILAGFLMPLLYGISMSVKSKEQISSLNRSPMPQSPGKFAYKGKKCDLFKVKFDDGTERELAIVDKGREVSKFIDPKNPDGGLIEWKGQWRKLEPAWRFDVKWENYITAWKAVSFLNLIKNSALYAIITTFGTLLSSLLVAYGFSRFKFPGSKALFIVLVATIILPGAVTLIPTYSMFYRIGWVGTWLPLMVPHFFANAYNVFLLRQFIMGIPREMDEAARIDGCGPLQTLFLIILPQAIPAVISVGLFHFFFAWNDFFGPLIYLAGKPDLYPITVGLSTFSNMYSTESHLVQATSIIACVIPFFIFFFAQKFFMEGVIVSGVEK